MSLVYEEGRHTKMNKTWLLLQEIPVSIEEEVSCPSEMG